MKLYKKHLTATFKSIMGEAEIVNPISKNPLHGVITPKVLAAMRKRTDAQLEQALREMGTKYLCHPANQVQRKDGKVYR